MIIRRKQAKGLPSGTSNGVDSRELTNGRKVNKSAVFLTINSNKLATAQDEQKFRNLVAYLAHDMEQFVTVLNYGEGRIPYSVRPAKPLKVRYAIEEGPERGLLHTHMLVKGKVYDAGVVQVDLNTTRGFLRKELGWCPRVYAEKAETNSRIENYMTKSFRQE